MEWLVMISTALVILLYLYSRLTMPTGHYGEMPGGPLQGGRGLAIGAVWGALVVLWLIEAAVPSADERGHRQKERQAAVEQVDHLAQEIAEKLETKREAELQARYQQKLAEENRRAEESRLASLDSEAQPEELGTIQLPAALKGPCMELQGCVCGMARQFHDNFILARRYRKWCRNVPRLRGDWACKGQWEVVTEDLRRNQFVLAEKGISFPAVCPLHQDGP